MDLEAEVKRLSDALQVCEFVLERRYPTQKQMLAAREASAAYAEKTWRTESVWNHIPGFLYYKGPDFEDRVIGSSEVDRSLCPACKQFPQLRVNGTFKKHGMNTLMLSSRSGRACPGSGKTPDPID